MEEILAVAAAEGWTVDEASVPDYITYLERPGEYPFKEYFTVYQSFTGRVSRAVYAINYRPMIVKGKAEIIRMLRRDRVRSAS